MFVDKWERNLPLLVAQLAAGGELTPADAEFSRLLLAAPMEFLAVLAELRAVLSMLLHGRLAVYLRACGGTLEVVCSTLRDYAVVLTQRWTWLGNLPPAPAPALLREIEAPVKEVANDTRYSKYSTTQPATLLDEQMAALAARGMFSPAPADAALMQMAREAFGDDVIDGDGGLLLADAGDALDYEAWAAEFAADGAATLAAGGAATVTAQVA